MNTSQEQPATRLAQPLPPEGEPGRSLSIVIPAYNEEHCIGDSLDRVMGFADGHPMVCEVIVVDDGSSDRTAAIAEGKRARHGSHPAPLRLLRHARNTGKGAAVRTGMLHAAGDIVLFTDADLSSPVSEIPCLVTPILREACDIVIGSRAIDRSLIAVRQGWFRETAGKAFNLLARSVTGLPIRDTQCGFKAFRRELILPVLAMQRVRTFAFDVELLYLASKCGLAIREVPVHWSHVSHTKVSLVRDSVRMFVDVLGIRLRDIRGVYRFNGQAPGCRHEEGGVPGAHGRRTAR